MNPYRLIRKGLWKLSTYPFQKGCHITRYSMYRSLAVAGKQLPNRKGRVLAISGSGNVVGVLGLDGTNVVEADFPKYNMLSLDFGDEEFDFVISDQVLEHLEGDPQRGIDECCRVLKPGGVAVHTTCFINPIHMYPMDFWRFTPAALRYLHRSWSTVIDVGSWGNRAVWSVVDRDGMRFEGVPNWPWHPLHRLALKNEPTWPIVTWIIARK